MNFIRVTPFMHVPDIGAAVAFFRDILGFAVPFHLHTYAYVQRETAAFRLLENARAEDGAPPGNRRYGYCIDVEDVDGLMAELKPKLDTLPRGDVLGPVDQPYGQREFMLVAPDGNLIVFGQSIAG